MPTTPQPNDVLRRWFDDSLTMLDPWVAAWTNAANAAGAATSAAPNAWLSATSPTAWAAAMTPTPAPTAATSRHHGHDHGHHDHDDHHCDHSHGCCGDRCGARDADLVLVARVGERRIVPLALHNEWRRERPVALSVSSFRPCDPCSEPLDISVTTNPGEEITLAPCSTTVVDVIVELPDKQGEAAQLTRCSTVYGDISTDGCARPVRLAVVVLAHDCDAHEIDCCGCGC
jgi:hypothetical protein